MKKNILIASVALGTLGVLTIGSAFAATDTGTTSSTSPTQMTSGFGGKGMKGGRNGGHMMATLTEAEKTALESMTDTEKQAFFDAKRSESEAKRTAHEAVIDKLLAGTTLTAEEETIRQTIITERAERKVREAEIQAKREQLKTILEKKAAGTTLTADEQALLDNIPQRGNKGDKRGGGRGMKNTTSSTDATTAQ